MSAVTRSVPVVSQYASPALVAEIQAGRRAVADDPAWPTTGAPDLESYAAWAQRWCGMACLRMALLARDGEAPTLHALATAAHRHGAYRDEPGAPGGLIYAPFVEFVGRELGLVARSEPRLTVEDLTVAVDAGALVIASVTSEVRRPASVPTRTGGHLVLVVAHEEGHLTHHDPAGDAPDSRVARLPVAVFARFFAGRGIVLEV